MIQGSIPQALLNCPNLEEVDLSRNGFSGRIPTEISKLQKLQKLHLQENKLSGNLPSELFGIPNLHSLFLHSNLLTGNIPTEVGIFTSVNYFTLNHNSFQGTIPTHLGKLPSLELLHLHHNQLVDAAPELVAREDPGFSYIADCGNPSFLLDRKLTCPGCTVCCNSLDQCQRNNTMPLNIQLLASLVIIVGLAAMPTLFFLFMKIKSFLIDMEFGNHRDPMSIYNKDSVYCLVFAKNGFAWFIYILTLAIQFSMFSLFLSKSDFNNPDTDWVFTMRCPDNSIECGDEMNRSLLGWILFYVITFLFTASDLMNSVLQLVKSVFIKDFQLFLSGLFLFALTLLAAFATIVYNIALAANDTDLLANAVILMFINDLDEQFLSVLETLAPGWIEVRLEEVTSTLEYKINVARVKSERFSDEIASDAVDNSDARTNSDDSSEIPLSRREYGLKMLGFENGFD